MYSNIIMEINKWMNSGGKLIEIQRDINTLVWVITVRDNRDGVYFAYTVGEKNKDFLLKLLNICWEKKYRINILLSEEERIYNPETVVALNAEPEDKVFNSIDELLADLHD